MRSIGVIGLDRHHHAEQVTDHADAAGERQQHERKTDDERIDPYPFADAPGDTEEHAVARTPFEAPGRGGSDRSHLAMFACDCPNRLSGTPRTARRVHQGSSREVPDVAGVGVHPH
jgi:hypothetical protein